ncbi:MAG TPA: ABC transporter permease [Candidatus Acidoferrales bacterium]|nr:ABC transporter permease [Candidatus Acidoferrales bacterium]
MKWWTRLVHKTRANEQLDSELRFHLEQQIADYISSGLSPDEARRRARLEFGGLDQVKERVQAAHRGYFIETLLQDVRYGLRMLRKSPGFTAVAVITLALGIGANTAIFSLIDAVLLRTLSVARPHELILFSDSPAGRSDSGIERGHQMVFSNLEYKYFIDHSESFSGLAAFQSHSPNLKVVFSRAQKRPALALGRMVSGNFFSLLGLQPAAGRLFSPDDDRVAAPPTAVLNYAYWSREFDDDPSAIGKRAEINGTVFTIIGVAPRKFPGIKYDHPDIWLPIAFQPRMMTEPSYAEDPHEYWLDILGRLKPGVTLRQAQIVVNAQLRQILAEQRETPKEIAGTYVQLAPGAWGISFVRSAYEQILRLLGAIIGFVLLIVCANVANLLLSRSAAREQEFAIRLAIGASRARLIRQLLTESVLLAAVGGALGILAAHWGIKIFAALITGVHGRISASVNECVLLFTIAVSILAGLLFGIIPSLRATEVDPARRAGGSPHGKLRFGFANGLVTFQIAASVVLLVGAGLFVRTLRNLANEQLGFDEDHILVARINVEAAGYSAAQVPALYQSLIDRAEAIPGVVGATVALDEPFSGSTWSSNFSIEGEPPASSAGAMVRRELVGPDYFQTEGIPILLGRDIGPQDRSGSPPVAVINETMARKFFHGVNPIGKRFSLDAPFHPDRAITVVGVAADARYYSLRDAVPPMEFSAALQISTKDAHPGFARTVELRVRGNPVAVASQVRAALAEVSRSLRLTHVEVLKDEVSESMWQNRSAAEFSSGFGLLALVLACIGVYGTMAYRVSRRTHEIGIRLALGATRSNVLRLVVKECLIVVGIGLCLGVPVALASTKMIASQLFGVRPTDPATFAGVALLLAVVALLACYIPARRAMRVDPIVALRHE